jgi:hypothetical protein
VYSTTLAATSTTRTRLERTFDAEAVRDLKAAAARDLTVSGPNLAAHAFREGVIDECHVFITAVFVGGGKQLFPDHVRVDQISTLLTGRGSTGSTVMARSRPPSKVRARSTRSRCSATYRSRSSTSRYPAMMIISSSSRRTPGLRTAYVETFRDPATVHAICEEYRAAVTLAPPPHDRTSPHDSSRELAAVP